MKYSSNELVGGVLSGNRDVLNFVYLYFGKVLSKFVYKNGGSNADVPDLMQETLLTIYERLKKNKDINNFGGFFYIVAKNKWIAKYTPYKKWHLVNDLNEDEYLVYDHSVNIENAIIDNDSLKLVKQIWTDVILKVNPRCEVILKNEFYSQPKLSGEELAKVLNTSHGTVRNAKYHCMEKLLTFMKRHPRFVEL